MPRADEPGNSIRDQYRLAYRKLYAWAGIGVYKRITKRHYLDGEPGAPHTKDYISMHEVKLFVDITPTNENYWRAIILFGRNVASYKFALAQALLEMSQHQGESILLEDLAIPFARHICAHLQAAPKQSTATSSRFLATCARYNHGELSAQLLAEATVRLGFNHVIDAFHIVNQQEVPIRFFADERKSGAIRLTDAFYAMQGASAARNLPGEVEARWRLVETAWALKLSRNIVGVAYDRATHDLFARAAGRRITVTSCRAALNGYQKGKCFYCASPVSICPGAADLADVDHFFPHALSKLSDAFKASINGVWNLVLACPSCNRGAEGKWAQLPALYLLERLHRRNEYLISSHHPLRETIIAQTGDKEAARRTFLQINYNDSQAAMGAPWSPKYSEAEFL